MRVATKYVNLTRRFFNEHGVTDYRIVESLGATEGAPAAGSAELIVDITTTGATLAANALKIIEDGTILRSEANLVASMRADWSAPAREAARAILSRLAAAELARRSREVRAFLPAGGTAAIAGAGGRAFGAKAGFSGEGRGRRSCARATARRRWPISCCRKARERVVVQSVEQVFETENPLYDALLRKSSRSA